MAFDMDSDRCVGMKRRITEIGDTEETPPPLPPLPPQFSTSVCTDNQDDQEEKDVAENKNLSLLYDSKKSKSSSHCDEASEIVTQGNQELGFASGTQQSGEVLGSLASEPSGTGDLVNKVEDFGGEVQKTENCEAGYVCDGEAKQENFDIEKGGVEETAKEGLLSASADKEGKAFVKSEVGVEVGFAKEESKELGKEFESEILLEVKKKQLLEKLEVVLMAEDKTQAERFADFEGSLKIEVIDQTALIDFNDKCAERKGNKNMNQEVDAKKARRSRRKAKKVFEMNRKNVVVRGETENGCRNIGDGTRKIYSRKEMEALRFANIVEQRKIWKVIYTGLGAAVAKEYEDLANSKNQKHIRVNLDPRQRIAKQEEAPAILREACSENMDSDIKDMESNETESLSPLDPTCSQSVSGEYGYTGLEEDSSDDDDSDEDYASIQKPAFLVEGEPNFDSGPPEDGFEYLRRVRWEASQIPKVKVAKFDRSKFHKEQSVYMPQIPDIAKCPEHLLPLKQWEDAFLADFSELRLALSRLEDSSEELSGKLQPMFVIHEKCHSRNLPWILEKLDTEEVHPKQPHDFSGPESSIDQPSMLTSEDHDTSSLPSEHSSPKTSAEEISGPQLSAILRMDSVARVSTLKKRISLVETTNTLSRNDCAWLFALCAAVDSPLDGDTVAALRSLLRKCAILRAAKSELDDDVVMLNILITVAGRYYGQSES